MALTVVENTWRLADVRGPLKISVRTTENEKKAHRDIAKFENTGWFMPFTVAIIIDFGLDLFSAIPIIGIIVSILSLPFVLYMIIFNFRHGKLHAKIMRFLLLLIDFIPIISPLWFGNIAVVFLMWNHMRRKKNKAQKYLAKSAQKKRAAIAYMTA